MKEHLVYEFRPIKPLDKCLRYNNGRWTPDDGEYDLAFVGYWGAPMGVYIHIRGNNIAWKMREWDNILINHREGTQWHYMLDGGREVVDVNKDAHPNEAAGRSAMDKCCEIYRCANGDGPNFCVGDNHIAAGLVRERESKAIVTFPKIFNCMYCGEIPIDPKTGTIMRPKQDHSEAIQKLKAEFSERWEDFSNLEKALFVRGYELRGETKTPKTKEGR